jgi:hypothetical protein
VGEAKDREDEHHSGADEGRDRRDAGDRGYGAEGVGVEQQAAQGLTLKHCGDRCCQRGVGGCSFCLGAELGIGLAAADRLEVNRDEVVGVGLGLLTGE